MKVTILGTGTSTGIPVPGCKCRVCTSIEPVNKRLRCSVYIQFTKDDIDPNAPKIPPEQNYNTDDQEDTIGSCLIDTSTDLRQQALRAEITDVRSVLYTHAHADHCHGIDDVRVFNFIHGKRIPVYSSRGVVDELEDKFAYVFKDDPNYQGGATAKLDLFPIKAGEPFYLFGVKVIPIPILHGKQEIFGYRFGNFAYLTDCSEIPKKSYCLLENLEILILDGLRYDPHPTHLSLDQAIQEVAKIKPKQTWLTHISHDVDHNQGNKYLRENSDYSIALSWDGQTLSL